MLAVYPATAQTLSPQEVFRRVAPSIVVVEVKDYPSNGPAKLIASGSGVVLPNEGKSGNKIVTNCHVVDDAEDGVVGIQQGDKWGVGFLTGRDEMRDLCVIDALMFKRLPGEQVDVSNVGGLQLRPIQVSSSRSLEVGDPVYAIGAPQGLELSLSNGLVSGFREYKGSEYIQTTAPISKGSSGGGLFDAQGQLVGITTMYVKDGQALNFAVPAELIAAVPDVGNGRGLAQPTGATATEAQAAADAATVAGEAGTWYGETNHNPKDRWWTFYEDNERAIAFDTESINKNGKAVTAWERTRYAKPKRADSGETYVEVMTRSTYYCGSRQSSYDQGARRNVDGEVITSLKWESWEVKRSDVMPDTIGESTYEAACSL